MPDDLFNRVFDSEFFSTTPIRNARAVAKAICDLHTATHSDSAFAEEVRLAWLALYDVAGPVITGRFLATGAWREYCPEVDSPTDSQVQETLWTDGERSVVVHLVFTHDEPRDLRFAIEDAATQEL